MNVLSKHVSKGHKLSEQGIVDGSVLTVSREDIRRYHYYEQTLNDDIYNCC